MERSARILIVDGRGRDGPNAHALGAAGFDCALAETAAAARAELEGGSFELILLAAALPDGHGHALLGELRGAGVDAPVILASGACEARERVLGLELGADDFVVEPVDPAELSARVAAVLRRREALPSLRVGTLEFDLVRRRVRRDRRWIELSPREFDLLLILARSDGRALTRGELLSQVWGIEFDPGTNLVDVQVGRLRRRLDCCGPRLIETVPGVGYRLRVDRG